MRDPRRQLLAVDDDDVTSRPGSPQGNTASRMAATARDLAALAQDFLQFGFTSETVRDRVRYVARSTRPGIGPHTVITADLTELRAALADGTTRANRRLRPEVGTP